MWVDGPSRAPDEVDAGHALEGRRDAAARDRDLARGGRGGGDHQALVEGLGRSARRDLCPDARSSSASSTDPRCSRSRSGSRPRSRTHAARRSPALRTFRAWSARRSSTGSCWSSCRELSRSDRARRPDLGPRPDRLDGHGRGSLARLAGRAVAHARADGRAGGAPGRLRAGRPARDGRLEPRARGDPPHVRRQRSARARHDPPERDQAPRGAARPRPHAVRGRVEVGDDARDALAARLLPRPRRRRVRRDHRSRHRAGAVRRRARSSSGSSTASRRSAGAIRRCPRSGSCRPC